MVVENMREAMVPWKGKRKEVLWNTNPLFPNFNE
jgi:hypothetical protein